MPIPALLQTMPGKVKHVETEDEYRALVEESKSKLVVIDFFATW